MESALLVAPPTTTDLFAALATAFADLGARVRSVVGAPPRQLTGMPGRAAAHFGGEVLAAEDLNDLARRLDRATKDPLLFELGAVSMRLALHEEPPSTESSVEVVREVDAWIGDHPAARFQRGLEDMTVAIALLHRRMAGQDATALGSSIAAQQASIESAVARGETPLTFVMDPAVHPLVAQALLDVLRGDLCGLTVLHGITSEARRPDPWLSLAITERWRVGQRQRLRLLQAMTVHDVDPKLLPLAERFDLHALALEVDATEAAYADYFSTESPGDGPRP